MSDVISRQAAIDTEGLDEQIRCEMCRNPMNTSRGCDGNCKYDKELYERIMQILDKRIKPLPSAQPYLQQTCSQLATDTIDRQAAMDFVGSMEMCDEISAEAYKKLMNYLEELPSAQPEQRLTCKNCIHLGHGYMMPCKNCKRNQMLPDWYEVETERQEE